MFYKSDLPAWLLGFAENFSSVLPAICSGAYCMPILSFMLMIKHFVFLV